MSLELTRINNHTIKLPDIPKPVSKWKGSSCLPVQYFVMALIGKRKTGKSTLIYTLIKTFATKRNMIVVFYCPTFFRDPNYDAVRKYLDDKGIPYQGYTSIMEDGINNVQVLLDTANEATKPEPETHDDSEPTVSGSAFSASASGVNFGKVDKPKMILKKKRIPKPPEYLIIFDDVSGMIRDSAVNKLFKNGRHIKARVICSSQSITDFLPSQLSQTDYVALFRDFNTDSIEKIYERIQPNISLEQFWELYKKTTSMKNTFLLVDRQNDLYRANLDKLIKL